MVERTYNTNCLTDVANTSDVLLKVTKVMMSCAEPVGVAVYLLPVGNLNSGENTNEPVAVLACFTNRETVCPNPTLVASK
jgi:hypothetical protein